MAFSRLLSVLFLLCLWPALVLAKDFYATLGLARGATDAQIKKAYRKLAVQYHPDKNKGDEAATAKFAEISSAYEVLSDEKKRKIYDRHGEEGLKQHEAQEGRGGGGDPSDIFSAFFGGGNPFGFGGMGGQEEEEQEKRGETVRTEIQLNLQELYLGTSLRITRDKNVIKPAKGTRKCKCRAKMRTKQIGPGMFQQFQVQECEECPNVKLVRESEFLTVDVDPGMKDGQELSFFEHGEPLIDGDHGDLKLIVREVSVPEIKFRRDGNDLHYDLTITLTEALVGFGKAIMNLDGRKVKLNVGGVTRPGDVQRIANEGMPVYNSAGRRGNMFVHYSVSFPDKSLGADDAKKVRDLFSKTSFRL